MEKELYETIEDFKDTLSEISSAREQVSNTVNAYAKTQECIQNYINKLEGVEHCLDELFLLLQNNKTVINQQASTAITNLQTTCDKVVEETRNKLSEASQLFSKELSSNLRVMSNYVEEFDKAIKKASALTNDVENMSNEVANLTSSINILQQELSTSQKEQNNILTHIDNGINSLAENNARIITLEQEVIGQVKTANNSIIGKLDDIQRKTEKSFGDMANNITLMQDSVNKNININRSFEIAILIFFVIFALYKIL